MSFDKTSMNEKILKQIDDCLERRPLGLNKVMEDGYFLNQNSKQTVMISFIIHGNETGPLETLLEFLQNFENKIKNCSANLKILLGNRAACLKNKRFLETDLNRSFLRTEKPVTLEQQRALEIEEFCKDCDLILDFHQTTAACEKAFFIYRDSELNRSFHRSFSSHLPAILVPVAKEGQVFSKDGMAFGDFARKQNIPMLTFESGESGMGEALQKSITDDLLTQFLAMSKLDDMSDSLKLGVEYYTWDQSIAKTSDQDELIPGLKNMMKVDKGQVLGIVDGQEFKAPTDHGVLLFPKYGEFKKAASELVRVLKPIDSKN